MTGDPYRMLLDVRSQRRPLSAYELLGLNEGEASDDAIRTALHNRRSVLHTRKSQASPLVWQRVSQELEHAAATLSDPAQKTAYDQEQQRRERPSSSGVIQFAAKHKSKGAMSSLTLPALPQIACRCGGFNPPGRKFCGACGVPLTEACPHCGASTMQGEHFCGACGVNLEDAAARQAELGEMEIARAAQLAAEGRYQEAEVIAHTWATVDSARLGDIVARARKLLDEIVAHREQSHTRVERAFDRARQAVDAFQWQEACDALASIPALLRTQDHEALLARAQENLEAVTYLHREIRTALKENRTLELLPKVERLLELEPHDERLKQLAEKLRRRHSHDARADAERLLKAAHRKLRDLKYDEALAMLESLPEGSEKIQSQQLLEQVRETVYLWRALRHTPVVEPLLVDIAQRLQKLSPHDPKVPAILAQLRERVAQTRQRPLATIPWAKMPEETPLGVPLIRLGDFGSVNVDAVVGQPLFTDNAPRLFTACGLALQGLGLAPVETNLLSSGDASMIGQLKSWVQRPRTTSSAWGIDLSSSGVKGVRLAKGPKNEAVAITAFDIVEHAAPLGSISGEAERRDALAQSLKKFFERNPPKVEAVCVGFPGHLALGRFFALPPVETKRVDDLMKYEAKQQVPFPLEQLVWDYHVWFGGEGADKTPRDAMLLAAKQHQVQQRLSLFRDIKVRVHALQSDCVALYNFYRFALADAGSAEAGNPCVMLLDVGADGTNFIIGDRESLWFRSVPRGGDDCNRAVMRQFEATFATAEQLKLNPAKARHISKLHEAWRPTFAQLLKDTRDSLAAFQSTDRARPLAGIYALGGGFRTHGLHRHFVGAS